MELPRGAPSIGRAARPIKSFKLVAKKLARVRKHDSKTGPTRPSALIASGTRTTTARHARLAESAETQEVVDLTQENRSRAGSRPAEGAACRAPAVRAVVSFEDIVRGRRRES